MKSISTVVRIKAPTPCRTTEEWLAIHRPKHIDSAETITIPASPALMPLYNEVKQARDAVETATDVIAAMDAELLRKSEGSN